MPKISLAAANNKKQKIEAAAKTLFIQQGFHGTPIRHIAAAAGVSLGNLYNYYRTKEEILESITESYELQIGGCIDEILAQLSDPWTPASLRQFGTQVRELVNRHPDFWLLMYIDVLEFQNRHCRKLFEGLTLRLKERFQAQFERLDQEGRLNEGVDPAISFTLAYLQMFNYCLIEKLFGGNQHLGVPDEEAIKKLSDFFCQAVLRPEVLTKLRAQC
jgi:AcrR family transcriptional regulator